MINCWVRQLIFIFAYLKSLSFPSAIFQRSFVTEAGSHWIADAGIALQFLFDSPPLQRCIAKESQFAQKGMGRAGKLCIILVKRLFRRSWRDTFFRFSPLWRSKKSSLNRRRRPARKQFLPVSHGQVASTKWSYMRRYSISTRWG